MQNMGDINPKEKLWHETHLGLNSKFFIFLLSNLE